VQVGPKQAGKMSKNAQKFGKIGKKLAKIHKNVSFLSTFFIPPCVFD